MIETVEGKNTNAIFFSKKSDMMFTCSDLIALKRRHRKRRIRAITLPGKGKGSVIDRRSPMQQSKKSRIICRKNLNFDTPKIVYFLTHFDFTTKTVIFKFVILTNIYLGRKTI